MAVADPLLLDHRARRHLPIPEQFLEAAATDVGIGGNDAHATLSELLRALHPNATK